MLIFPLFLTDHTLPVLSPAAVVCPRTWWEWSAAIDVGPRLVRHFHKEVAWILAVIGMEEEVEDLDVHGGTEIVHVGDKDELFAFLNELV